MALGNAEQLQEAEEMVAEAVRLNEKHRPGSADLASSYDLHGGRLLDLARAGRRQHLPLAARRYQQALALWRRLFGRRSELVAMSLNNLGTVRFDQGRIAAAARLQEVSLGIRRTALSPGDARLAVGPANTGSAWLVSGAADRAEPLLREALETLETVFAARPEHPDNRNAAGWLTYCILVRALAGEDRAAREAEAQAVCDRYGFDFAQQKEHARKVPYHTGSGSAGA